jgi:uncharacterized protein DUF3617
MRAIHYAAMGLVVALGACGKSGDGSKAGGGGSILGGGSGAATIQPGLWEMSSEANISGAGVPPAYAAAMKGHKETRRDCITPEEAAQPTKMMKQEKDSNCDYSGFSFGNGHIQGTISCGAGAGKPGGKMTMTMNGQYDAQNYAYTSTMTSEGQGMHMTIETKAVAHRVGDCPAGGAESGK